MNIFYLHNNPKIAAQFHCNKHVVKMIQETAQILSTAHHLNSNGDRVTLKPTHVHHPSVIWASSSTLHYKWLQLLGEELCKEYQHRYYKVHQYQKLIEKELKKPPRKLDNNLWQPPPKCMPDEYKKESVEASYQAYYLGAKSHFAKYTNRNVPKFMKEREK